MPNKNLVRNPALNEFIWTLLYNITPEQKKKLSSPFLRILKSSIKSKFFSEFSTLDEKVRLLSELGYENAIVFFEDKAKSVNALKVILQKYEDEKNVSASKDITQLRCFVSSDKQVKWLLSLMADSIHHKSYFLNLEYSRVSHHLKSWKPFRKSPSTAELSETIDSADLLAKTLLNAISIAEFSEGFMGVRPLDLKILLLLYGFRHTYVEKERIWDYFAGTTNKQRSTTSLKRLFANQLVSKHIDTKVLKYGITSTGIETVGNYMQRVLKQNNF